LTASPAAYALVGMGAVVAGTTHAPITAIIIIFELSNNYKIILSMMIICILSTMVASSLKKGSIYTIKLLRRGVDVSGGMEQNLLRSMEVGQFMLNDPPTIPEGMRLLDLIRAFKTEDVSYLHVVDGNKDLTGIISFRDIRPLFQEEQLHLLVVAKDVATTNLKTVTRQDSILKALQIMGDLGISQLPVLGGENGKKVIGTLRDKDVIAAYDKAIIRHEIEAG
jgi:CIC family chloride channel protein